MRASRRLVGAIALALLAGLATPVRAEAPPPAPLPPQAIARAAFPSVVVVVLHGEGTDHTSLGSGFFVGEGLVATNFHVIAGTTGGWVRVIGEARELRVEGVVAADRAHDLAILKVRGEAAPLPLGRMAGLSVADKVYAIGNPRGLEGTFSEGLVSSIRRRDGAATLQITAPISQGSSGGPVFDDRGRVVGVAVGMLEAGQNLNFAIPADYLEALLAGVGSPVPLADLEASPAAAPTPPPEVAGEPAGPDGRTPIDCGTFTCHLPTGWALERNQTASAAFSAARRQGGFALLTVFFRDQAHGEVDDYAGSAIATLGEKYLRHRVVDLAGERAYLIMYKARVDAGPVFASDLRVVHGEVEYTISLWSDADADAADTRAIGEEFEALARSWRWK